MSGTRKLYINGEWVETEETFESLNPSTGSVVGTLYEANESHVDEAVEAAEESFDDWRSLSYTDRAEYLWEIHDWLLDNVEELGEMVSRESGKEIKEGRADIREAAHMVEWAAGNARHPHGDVVPSEIAEKDAYMRRKPRGVTACITPWNFPIAIPFWHMAVTLVEGNTVVWKPAEQTPICGSKIAEMFDEIDVPDGVFNLVQGHGSTVGDPLARHEDVQTVLFTGSAEVGEHIQQIAAEQPQKQTACEMGGKNALVITENAKLELAVKCAVLASFKTTGQRCVSTERLIIHEDIYDDFKEQFVNVAQSIAVGDPLEEDTFMGPLVDENQVEKFENSNEKARETESTNILVDREDLDEQPFAEGNWVGPFVYEVDEYDSNESLLKDEVFGPHVALIPYSGSLDRGMEIHNDTPYGLTGAIISEDYREINQFRDEAEVGLAYANLPCIGAEVQLPFGGVKKSGNGDPSAREIIEAVTDRTAWTVNNDTDVELAQGLSAEITTEK